MRNRKGNSAKGREGGWKRRNEVEEEDRRRGVDERGMPREGDDEETVVARTMTRSGLASETKETVRYKRNEQEP